MVRQMGVENKTEEQMMGEERQVNEVVQQVTWSERVSRESLVQTSLVFEA